VLLSEGDVLKAISLKRRTVKKIVVANHEQGVELIIDEGGAIPTPLPILLTEKCALDLFSQLMTWYHKSLTRDIMNSIEDKPAD
jgi:hypothetical protein